MCWSFKVSFYTFIVSVIASSYLWLRNKKNDRLFSCYIFSIGLIQGIEALGWYSVNTRNDKLNKIAGRFLEIGIWLQFVMLYSYMYYSTKNILFLYLTTIFLFVMLKSTNKKHKITLNCNFDKTLLTTNNLERKCSIEWNWLGNNPVNINHILYLIGLFLPIIFIKDKRIKYLIIIPILTYIFAAYKYNKTNVWSGYWCLISNIWIPFLLI